MRFLKSICEVHNIKGTKALNSFINSAIERYTSDFSDDLNMLPPENINKLYATLSKYRREVEHLNPQLEG